jgi:hypothetical protein
MQLVAALAAAPTKKALTTMSAALPNNAGEKAPAPAKAGSRTQVQPCKPSHSFINTLSASWVWTYS